MFRARRSLPIAAAAMLCFMLAPGLPPAALAQAPEQQTPEQAPQQTPAPPAAEPPAAPPAAAQPTPEAAPAEPPSGEPDAVASSGALGEEVEVAAKTVIFLKGTAKWDTAYDTLIDGFKTVYGFLEKEGIKPAGAAMTIYLSTDDQGFDFHVAVPIAEPMASPPRGDLEMGQSPAGRMLKFVHRGPYDAMDSTYEAITNFLDAKELEAQEVFIEEYVTDPLKTAADDLVINVLVPVK